MIELKTARELALMRRAGAVVAGLLEALVASLQPGMRTRELDELARAHLRREGAAPAFLGYRGFPASICVSVNDEVVHGIPGERRLREGDLVSLDAGAVVDGYYADAALTVGVGTVSETARRLMAVTREALEAGIAQARAGQRLSDISHAVQQRVERERFGVVREFVGHGIGRAMHEEPPIPNFGAPNAGPRLQEGMVLAIEPMVTAGGYAVSVLQDGWTAVTQDGSLAAHFEHTVAVTAGEPEILTALPDAERRAH
jgi:methionyl aminopeptidase